MAYLRENIKATKYETVTIKPAIALGATLTYNEATSKPIIPPKRAIIKDHNITEVVFLENWFAAAAGATIIA